MQKKGIHNIEVWQSHTKSLEEILLSVQTIAINIRNRGNIVNGIYITPDEIAIRYKPKSNVIT